MAFTTAGTVAALPGSASLAASAFMVAPAVANSESSRPDLTPAPGSTMVSNSIFSGASSAPNSDKVAIRLLSRHFRRPLSDRRKRIRLPRWSGWRNDKRDCVRPFEVGRRSSKALGHAELWSQTTAWRTNLSRRQRSLNENDSADWRSVQANNGQDLSRRSHSRNRGARETGTNWLWPIARAPETT